jgi:two-component system, OmpR family, response regulator TctD
MPGPGLKPEAPAMQISIILLGADLQKTCFPPAFRDRWPGAGSWTPACVRIARSPGATWASRERSLSITGAPALPCFRIAFATRISVANRDVRVTAASSKFTHAGNRCLPEAMRILLVEDNRDLGEAIERRLRAGGHRVVWNTDGKGIDAQLEAEEIDAMILDLTLPQGDGIDILRRLRRARSEVPVLITTARAEVDQKVSLLDLGADDYLVKPFDLRELEARLRAIVRRPAGRSASEVEVGPLTLDPAGHLATLAGRPLDLGLREFRLLEILSAHHGRVVARERLMARLFDLEDGGSENALELLVSRLRRKLGDGGIEVVTLRGVGYLLRAQGSGPA